jgi:hypothetical protein
MASKKTSSGVLYLRWAARLTSLCSLAMLGLFLQDFDPSKIRPNEWVGLAFFPFGLMIGMVLGWKWPGVGGLVGLGSLAGFYLVYGLVLAERFPTGPYFALFAFPALLFALEAWFTKTVPRQPRHA